MHYANGREAKNGDKIVVRQYNGTLISGVLYDAVPGNDYCNGKVAVIGNDLGVNLKECLHIEDVDVGVLKPKPKE